MCREAQINDQAAGQEEEYVATHYDSLANDPVRYPLLIQAPCVKRGKAKQIAQLCPYCLDVLRGKMKLPHNLYPGWAFSAAQLKDRINTSLLLQHILLQHTGPGSP